MKASETPMGSSQRCRNYVRIKSARESIFIWLHHLHLEAIS